MKELPWPLWVLFDPTKLPMDLGEEVDPFKAFATERFNGDCDKIPLVFTTKELAQEWLAVEDFERFRVYQLDAITIRPLLHKARHYGSQKVGIDCKPGVLNGEFAEDVFIVTRSRT